VQAVDGFDFAAPVRVRFAETDAQGVAHNSNYLVWFEIARVGFLEAFAGGYQRLRDQGIESLVLEAHVRFRAPAVFDDRLLVHTRCHDLRGARFRFEYLIERGEIVIADGWTAHATVDAATLRPTRTPEWLRAAIAGTAARPSRAAGSTPPEPQAS
jgi:acyl-CoA thioester hydrolase